MNGADFISFDDDLPIRRHIDRFLKEHDVEVNIALHFDNIQMIKEAVTHRVGVSILPVRTMRDDIAAGEPGGRPDRGLRRCFGRWALFIGRRSIGGGNLVGFTGGRIEREQIVVEKLIVVLGARLEMYAISLPVRRPVDRMLVVDAFCELARCSGWRHRPQKCAGACCR